MRRVAWAEYAMSHRRIQALSWRKRIGWGVGGIESAVRVRQRPGPIRTRPFSWASLLLSAAVYRSRKFTRDSKSMVPLLPVFSASMPDSWATATGFSPPSRIIPSLFTPTWIRQTASLALPT
jgi:hypothetical protein